MEKDIKQIERTVKNYKRMFGVLIIILFVCGSILIFASFNKIKLELQRDYYKDQMLSFCRQVEFYNNLQYPFMYPCERWVVPK